MPNDDDAQTLPTASGIGPIPARAQTPSPDRDRYALGVPIGRGGMGEIRLAHDVRIERDVAVKLMRPDMRDDASMMRFYREARIQGRLDHPAIPPVHDLGVDDHGTPYFVMKRLTGTTLRDVLAGHPSAAKWPRRLLLAKLVDVCLELELAHSREIVHRDLKPSNIMLGDYGEVYVLDWGLARVIDARRSQPAPLVLEPDARTTSAGEIVGTPGYMAPEQVRDAAVDGRADVYALGCILYEVVTGEAALPHGLPALAETLTQPCRRPSERFPDVPPELDDLCARATAADLTARPSARELADGIQAYLDGDRDLARRRELAAQHAARAIDAATYADDQARAAAIREAGRALALDAENAAAQAVLGRLLLDAPSEVPRAAAADVERDRVATRSTILRAICRAYLGITVMFAAVFALPVNHPGVVAAGLGLCATATATAALGARRSGTRRSRQIGLALLWLNAGSIALAAIVFGPMLVIPTLVIGSIGIALAQPIGYGWPMTVGSQVLGIVVPLALEWLGVLPPTYHIAPDGLVLSPWVVSLTPGLAIGLMLVALITQVVTTTIVQVARNRAQRRVEDRLYAMRWHLEQLLPRRHD